MDKKIEIAAEHVKKLIEQQLSRVEQMKSQGDFVDYSKLDKLIIGCCGGDGIGPIITAQTRRVLEYMLSDEVESGKVEFRDINGLTIENRVKCNKAIPDDVMDELKKCHVILKGPTTTPRAGDPWPNIESANVAMRKELDLFANVRPVKVPEEGIDWVFFRENTEGSYTLGSCGIDVDEDLAFDFTVTTTQGTKRIAELAYDYAVKNSKDRVSIITKANVVKTTDGKFLKLCREVGEKYPQGKYADPCSMLRAAVLLLEHIGFTEKAEKLERALDICMYEEKKYTVTGRNNGCTCDEFGDYVMHTIQKL